MMLLDTFAWVELFQATNAGEKVRSIIQDRPAYTSVATLAEITVWALRYGKDPDLFIERIEKLSSVLPLNREILTRAGKVTHERKKDRSGFGIMDGLIYATARLHQLEMLTGDPHFQGLPGVVFL